MSTSPRFDNLTELSALLTSFHFVYYLSRYRIDFATVVTEDSDIFTSCPGKTDVRGKGSQFEAAFNFIRHVALQDEENDNAHILCIDSDLKGEQNQTIFIHACGKILM